MTERAGKEAEIETEKGTSGNCVCGGVLREREMDKIVVQVWRRCDISSRPTCRNFH